MAGESPDKSEQRKSSGETAPGERDPRLATAVHPDQPTAVFTLPPDPDADGDGEPAGETGADADAGDDTDAEVREAGRRALAAGADAPTAEVTAVVPALTLSAPEKPREAPEAPEGAEEATGAAEDAPDAVADGGGDEDGPRNAADAAAAAAADDDTADEDGPGSADRATTVLAAGSATAGAGADEGEGDSDGGRGAVATVTREESGAGSDTDRDADEDAADDSGDADGDADESGDQGRDQGRDEDGGEDGGRDGESGGDKPAVDTPTAVLGALRKPAAGAPAVDSPTTALKLPPAPRPESDPAAADAETGGKSGDQGDGESDGKADGKAGDGAGRRASTFVPLKNTEPKPAPAVPAAPAPVPAAAAPPAPEAAALAEAERTRQQPMPPLPPMDLLAELTNTPPTPMRKVARRFKIWTPLVLLLMVVGAVAQILRPLPPPDLELSTQPTFTFKGAKLTLPFPADGQGAVAVEGVGTIGTYGPQEVAPTASVAKAMTAYVVLRDRPLKKGQEGKKITVDKQAAEETKRRDSESVAEISEGQEYTQKQMLQLMMIPSGNNAARLLARWHSGSEAAFVAKMNEAAKSLGMNNTVYTDPSGFKKTTTSTPEDQLKLAEAVMNDEVLREITNTTMTDIPGAGSIRNGNDRALLLDGVDGIKTGSSTPAGGNLLWSFVKPIDGTLYRVNGIAMNVRTGDSPYQKTQKAIDYSVAMIDAARKGLAGATIVKKGEPVGYLDNGLGGRVPVVATKDLKAVGWGGLELRLNLTMKKGDLPRSGNAGDVIGELSIGSGPARELVPVALRENLTEPSLTDKLTRLG
ncbi:D-alanyl-D-alanine carboxypeptidase [Streptomyces tsukubensis]|uniref:D-alanyl-D-alanine carboxypeptidase n=1 Tax=Streptomyces tsukubensis TaxID=83656 RepID=UPI00344CF646